MTGDISRSYTKGADVVIPIEFKKSSLSLHIYTSLNPLKTGKVFEYISTFHCNLHVQYIQNFTVHSFCYTVLSNGVERTLPHRFDICSSVRLNIPVFVYQIHVIRFKYITFWY